MELFAPKGRERLREEEKEERMERGPAKRFYKSMEVWMLQQSKL